MNTLNKLCLILNCKVEDILLFTATEEETTAINERQVAGPYRASPFYEVPIL